MSLPANTCVGQFEILALLGRGGMGEVYRARDTKLQRDVALKLVAAEFGTDADRLARFTREAQVLASLNHPNIGAIYGVEETDRGTMLVLELVDGPTLASRIAQGPVSAPDAIRIARQVAEALEAAHEQGIVHRDLKPANVKLRSDGSAKVLDFGLAKAPMTAAATEAPTVTSPAMTAIGVILGTAAYMAPEQARGLPVDKRADIWAFGVLLFEMLAARRPFAGGTVSDTLAAILKDPPAWSALPADLPASLRTLLGRLLEKDPRRRLRDIGDARLALEDLQAGTAETPAAGVAGASSAMARALPWALAAAAVSVAIFFAVRPAMNTTATATRLVKFTLPIAGDSVDRTALPAISPDGRSVAVVKGGTLWVQPLDQLEPKSLAGTNGARFPFWSPDSREIAYFTATDLWRVGIDGTPPVRIASAKFTRGGRTPGGVWLTDRIVFAPATAGSGLLSVPLEGGEFTVFQEPDDATRGDFHRPSVLPDGRSLLFAVDRRGAGADTIGVLANGARKDLLTVNGATVDSPVYSSTGHILYHSETTTPGVWAVPFSAGRLEITGKPFLVAPQGSYPSIGADGTLIFWENALSGLSSLVWLDIKTGEVTPALRERFDLVREPRLSPNGRLVAALALVPDRGSVVMIGDLQRQTHVDLPAQVSGVVRLAWVDDRTIVYARSGKSLPEIVVRPADGSGSEIPFSAGMHAHVRNGQVVFARPETKGGVNLYHGRLSPTGLPSREPERLQELPEREEEPALSPDGTLLLFTRGELGQSHVILRTYPTLTGQWQVSANGGNWPVWSPRGDAIYYREPPGQIMRVTVSSRPQVSLGTPTPVAGASGSIARVGFDVSLDGSKLLTVQEALVDERRRPSLAVVQNWFASAGR